MSTHVTQKIEHSGPHSVGLECGLRLCPPQPAPRRVLPCQSQLHSEEWCVGWYILRTHRVLRSMIFSPLRSGSPTARARPTGQASPENRAVGISAPSSQTRWFRICLWAGSQMTWQASPESWAVGISAPSSQTRWFRICQAPRWLVCTWRFEKHLRRCK